MGESNGAEPHASGVPITPADLPPVVYVPSQQLEPGDTELNIELRYLTDGRVAVLAYTSLDRLVAACGRGQPWALLRTEQLDELREQTPFDVVANDPEVPAELRKDQADGGEG